MYCYSGRVFQNMCHYLANLYPISIKFSQNVASDMSCMMKKKFSNIFTSFCSIFALQVTQLRLMLSQPVLYRYP